MKQTLATYLANSGKVSRLWILFKIRAAQDSILWQAGPGALVPQVYKGVLALILIQPIAGGQVCNP